MVKADYAHIWDCCCDHGLLGAALLARQAAPQIHFVDILPDLVAQLNHQLKRFHPTTPNAWKTHCLDTAALPLEQYTGKHLIIIAGVGGDLMTRFVQAIHRQHPLVQLDFLLCPVHQEYHLRQQLIALDFCLQQEVLLEENRRFYEVLLVSANRERGAHRKVSPVGETIWLGDTRLQQDIARNYLSKTLKHYRKVKTGNAVSVQHVIDAYRAVRVGGSAKNSTDPGPNTSNTAQKR